MVGIELRVRMQLALLVRRRGAGRNISLFY